MFAAFIVVGSILSSLLSRISPPTAIVAEKLLGAD
jgi:hypothetical protein